MGAPDRDHRPQYGWDRVTFTNDTTLGEPGGVLPSESEAFERPNGLYRVSVTGRVDAGDSSGTGRFGFFVEGSNTGGSAAGEWLILGETNLDELFTAGAVTNQARILALSRGGGFSGEGFIGEGQLPVDRWKFLRLRTFVEFEEVLDPVSFEMSVRMTGVGADGQTTLYTSTLVRVSGDASEPESDPIKKPEGVRYVSAQAFVDAMIVDGAGAFFNVRLEAAQNQNAVNNDQWTVLDVLGPFTAAGDSAFFANGRTRIIDLNGFQHYRFVGEKGSVPPTDLSSYTIRCLSVFDDADWIDGEQGIPLLNENLRKTFIILVFDPVTNTGGNTREVRVQICDMNQIPIRENRRIGLLLSNSFEGGTDDLAAAATFVSVTAPAILVYGAANNVAVIETETDGTAFIQLDNGGAPAFLYGWNERLPPAPRTGGFGPGQIMIGTDRADLT